MNSHKSSQSPSRALEFLCRHLVALCVTYQECNEIGPTGEPRFFACPGTIICIRGVYSLLTAGHTLKDWDEAIRRGRVRVLSAVLADIFGSERVTEEPIPFDFVNEPRFYIDDEEEGLDFGLVALQPYYARLLAKNGIKAIFEENWIHQHTVKFDGYAMLGLPEEFITSQIDSSRGDIRVLGAVSPTMIVVTRLEQPPPERVTQFPRFVGQLYPGLELTSIKGMNGGPILGFSFGPPMAYWVVAIQSSWLPQSRITFGCPLPVLGELIASWVDQLQDRGGFISGDDPASDKKGEV